MKRRQRAFTLVEIMIVVAIIGIVIAIAVPAFLNARQTARSNACMEAQEKMEGAIANWALDNSKEGSDQPASYAVIVGTKQYLKRTPICPVNKLAVNLVTPDTPVTCPNGITEHARF